MSSEIDFAAAVNDPTTSLAIERCEDDAPVPALVSFGGISGGLFGPPFEFLSQTDGLGVHRVFLTDVEQCWYQRGLPDLGGNVLAVAEGLDGILDDLGASRRVFVGTSSGGFAAILFGVLLGADVVLAFSPQASLTISARRHAGDRRWRPQVRKARRSCSSPLHSDLVRLLSETEMSGMIKVHFETGDPMDTVYARDLEPFECVEVFAHSGGHSFVRQLRESNQLRSILANALTG